jgi:hypothetical protein
LMLSGFELRELYFLPSTVLSEPHPTWERILLWSPGWPQTHGSLVWVSQVLGLHAYATMLSSHGLPPFFGYCEWCCYEFYVAMFQCLGWTLRSRIAALHANSMLSSLRSCQTVFQSGSTVLHSHQQRPGLPSSHILVNTAVWSLTPTGRVGGEKWHLLGFDLHFSKD